MNLTKHNARKQAGVMGKTLTSWTSSQGKNNTSIDVAKHPLTAIRQAVNNGGLSNPTSVTPQRHCGFFMPKICLASQARQTIWSSEAAALLRLQSVYDGMTPQNTTPFWGNMRGGSSRPRVNPVTHSAPQTEWGKTQKLLGVPIMAVKAQYILTLHTQLNQANSLLELLQAANTPQIPTDWIFSVAENVFQHFLQAYSALCLIEQGLDENKTPVLSHSAFDLSQQILDAQSYTNALRFYGQQEEATQPLDVIGNTLKQLHAHTSRTQEHADNFTLHLDEVA